MMCPDCKNGDHPRSECPALLPCPYWADHIHAYHVDIYRKRCACGAKVKPGRMSHDATSQEVLTANDRCSEPGCQAPRWCPSTACSFVNTLAYDENGKRRFCGKCYAGYTYRKGDSFDGTRCECNPEAPR